MIDAQPDSLGTGAGGSESVAREGSGSLTTRLSCRVRSMFSSIAARIAAPEAVSIHPFSIGAVGSELRVEADVGAAFRALLGGRARSRMDG